MTAAAAASLCEHGVRAARKSSPFPVFSFLMRWSLFSLTNMSTELSADRLSPLLHGKGRAARASLSIKKGLLCLLPLVSLP